MHTETAHSKFCVDLCAVHSLLSCMVDSCHCMRGLKELYMAGSWRRTYTCPYCPAVSLVWSPLESPSSFDSLLECLLHILLDSLLGQLLQSLLGNLLESQLEGLIERVLERAMLESSAWESCTLQRVGFSTTTCSWQNSLSLWKFCRTEGS